MVFILKLLKTDMIDNRFITFLYQKNDVIRVKNYSNNSSQPNPIYFFLIGFGLCQNQHLVYLKMLFKINLDYECVRRTYVSYSKLKDEEITCTSLKKQINFPDSLKKWSYRLLALPLEGSSYQSADQHDAS